MSDAPAQVANIFICQVHRFPMKELDEVRLVADRGAEGCIHARPGSRRQLLLMDGETLAQLNILPGAVKENLTTRGLALRELITGQRLRVGDALLEVVAPCEPCARMEEIRAGLEHALRGRRGVFCRVVEGGLIRRGDQIHLTPTGVSAELREAQ